MERLFDPSALKYAELSQDSLKREKTKLQKKILITVSEDVSYQYGLRFAGSFFNNKSAVSATLFYIASPADSAVRGAGQELIAGKLAEARKQNALQVLDAARRKLCDRGFPSENVSTKFIFRQFGTARDIVREARAGNYDTVILGRRGYLLFESIFSMSVTRQILDLAIEPPIWICRRPDENRRNVLLCVDGSSASFRMVDHVGFMLTDEDRHSVTLFHVDTGEGRNKEAIMDKARGLIERQIPQGRVESIVVSSTVSGVGKKILEEAAAKNYAAVGVGRVGSRKGRIKEWLTGSRTMKLVESMEKTALWVSG